MAISIQFHGGAGEVTGSCHLVEVSGQKILLDCGMIQGSPADEKRNHLPFPFDPEQLDAVILSHAHIDHSGRLPLLVKSGFRGTIYTHPATADLCKTMLRDAGNINEKETEWENRKRERKGLKLVEPLFTVQDAENSLQQFETLKYGIKHTIGKNITIRLNDAGHILGSSIIELWLSEKGHSKKIVYSGDLGRSGMPILQDPVAIKHADTIIMESTYGDRLHRSWLDTMEELLSIFSQATSSTGNILIPAFAVGRTQEILYLFSKYYQQWNMERWHIFLDSPMAIEATETYARNSAVFDDESLAIWKNRKSEQLLPNLHFTRTAEESMQINNIRNGAIIIAGSGMCDGGRIKHHLKHNAWREDCHLVISGYQAQGTLGRKLVDGAKHIRLWGETIRVRATIHTIGGLSAHADQNALVQWYNQCQDIPPLILVHGEKNASESLAQRIREERTARVLIATPGMTYEL